MFRLDFEPHFGRLKKADIIDSYSDTTKAKKELRFDASESATPAWNHQFLVQ
jgi:hypothetical protein